MLASILLRFFFIVYQTFFFIVGVTSFTWMPIVQVLLVVFEMMCVDYDSPDKINKNELTLPLPNAIFYSLSNGLL